jgi:2'-5' RNA ligase
VRVEPFILPVAGVGAFPPKRAPRVLWCGIGRGHTRLHQLRQRLDDAILGAGLNPDLRTFSPHITLARCGETAAESVEDWLHKQHDCEAPPFRVTSFNLYASELTPDGAVHTLKQSFVL